MGAFLIVLASTVTVFGNILAKSWADRGEGRLFLYTQIAYLLGALAFPFALRYGSFTVIASLASVVTALATIVIGMLYYHDRLGPLHMAGLALSVLAVVLLSVPEKA